MVFLAEKILPIPPADILSWIFDQVPYDIDEPVLLEPPSCELSSSQMTDSPRRLRPEPLYLQSAG